MDVRSKRASRLVGLVAVAAVAVAATAAVAQDYLPQAKLSPAPLMGIGKDLEGRPIPFGVPPYYSPDTPLGSGPYKAIMVADPSLPEHILYYPANMAPAGKLPILSWGNGACIHAGNRFRSFLTEIASRGVLVISAGQMADPALEVGPQENPVVILPGQPVPLPAPPAPPIPNDRTAKWRAMRSTSDHMKQAIDWAIAENGRPGSRFYGRLDTSKVGVAGQSCGGGLTLGVVGDARVTAAAVLNSGSRLTSRGTGAAIPPADLATAKARLDAIHTPVLFLTGDEAHDSAYSAGRDSFGYVSKVPAFYAWEDGLGHITTYGAPNGGAVGRIVADWFAWRLRGDQQAGRTFAGADCTLCREPTWHVQKKNMP